MRGLFLVLVPLFPIRGLFLALPAILLSPKRCLCVNYARFARIMRRPLGTGRQPLNAVGRLILLSPKRCSCVKLCSLRSHNCASRLGRAANRLTRLDAILLSPKRCSCVKLCSLRSHNCASRLGRVANRLTRLDVILFPCVPHNSTPSKDWVGKAKPCRRFLWKRLAGKPAPPNFLRAWGFWGMSAIITAHQFWLDIQPHHLVRAVFAWGLIRSPQKQHLLQYFRALIHLPDSPMLIIKTYRPFGYF